MATLQELIAQRDEIEKQIQERRQADLDYAVASVHALIAEYGLTQIDIFGAARNPQKDRSAGSKLKVAAKYRDPATGKE
jgi:DNA-binding protein H-NS